MICYLVRHGEAKSEVEDQRRPLTEFGRSQVEKTGRAAVARGVRAAEIWHSDKLRARQTAEILARFLAAQDSLREIEGLAPNEDPTIAQVEIKGAPDPIMVVGHLPHLSRLASLLVSGDPEKNRIEFPTAAIVCLSRDSDNWKVDWTLAPDQS
jgi:phosphohistidine phosphatase